MDPLVSVIMPAYNCEQYVEAAIQSILNQSYTNFELLIADDASTDSTRQKIDAITDSRIRRFHDTANKGYLGASNALMPHALGAFITFQDADDYAHPGRLEKLVNAFREQPGVSVIGSNVTKVDMNDIPFSVSDYPQTHAGIQERFINYKTVMTGSALMVRKEVIEALGFYNPYFSRLGWEDVYWYSVILKHYKAANIPEALYFYRANPGSASRTYKSDVTEVGHDLIIDLYRKFPGTQKDYIQQENASALEELVCRLWISKHRKDPLRLLFAKIKTKNTGVGATLRLIGYAIYVKLRR